MSPLSYSCIQISASISTSQHSINHDFTYPLMAFNETLLTATTRSIPVPFHQPFISLYLHLLSVYIAPTLKHRIINTSLVRFPLQWGFSGISTFAHLPHRKCLTNTSPDAGFDIGIIGAPFDTAVSYRPGEWSFFLAFSFLYFFLSWWRSSDEHSN